MKTVGILAAGVLLAASAAWAATTETVGGWEVSTIKDPITDKGRVIGSLRGTGGMFVVKCDEAGPQSVYLQFIANDYLGGQGARSTSRTFTYRIDDDPPVVAEWRYNDRWAALVDKQAALRVAGRLAGAKRLIVRAKDFRYMDHDAQFELEGADRALPAVVAGCGAAWPSR